MDDTLEFLTKIYSELTAFRKETKEDIQGLKNDVIEIENKMNGLYDGYKQTYEKLEVIDDKVDSLVGKVDRHDIKIQVIEGGRK